MSIAEEDPLAVALTWIDEGRAVAVATVVDTWGSSPRPRGSQIAVRDDGLFVGSVSGGCVEGKVVEAAQAAMSDRAHRLLEFGVSNEEAWDVGLACGGTVKIYVEPVFSEETNASGVITRGALASIRQAREKKVAIVLLTPLDGSPAKTWSPGDANLDDDLREAAERAIAGDDASTIETTTGKVFVQAINPPLKLLVIGAVHIASPLVAMAKLLGYDVTLVDPRASFSRAERWPGVNVVTAWPDEALQHITLDHRTAVVTLTHDPKIDDLGLEAALHSTAFYVGALGSKKTHAARLARLGARGFGSEALARIHGPVGLRIGAKSPAEIATSILAQMTEQLRAPPKKIEARPRIAAVVLAAGLSRRMGGPNKLLAELDGKPIITQVVDALLASKVDSVFVVVGFESTLVQTALGGRAVTFVENADYEEGLGASLRAGIGALGTAFDGALVVLGDMPWIRSEHVNKLISAFDPKTAHTIWVPVHDRKRGHPVLWSSLHFDEMRKLGGDVGARSLLERHHDAVCAVEVDDAAVHLDIDTAEMLANAQLRKM